MKQKYKKGPKAKRLDNEKTIFTSELPKVKDTLLADVAREEVEDWT